MTFDDINDTTVSLEDIMNIACRLVPHEEIAVVGTRDNKLVLRTKKIYYAGTEKSVKVTLQLNPEPSPSLTVSTLHAPGKRRLGYTIGTPG